LEGNDDADACSVQVSEVVGQASIRITAARLSAAVRPRMLANAAFSVQSAVTVGDRRRGMVLYLAAAVGPGGARNPVPDAHRPTRRRAGLASDDINH
jgi:hypothetical protein